MENILFYLFSSGCECLIDVWSFCNDILFKFGDVMSGWLSLMFVELILCVDCILLFLLCIDIVLDVCVGLNFI